MDGDTAMKKAYEMSTCNFCHIGGMDDRKHRNEYGQALDKLLDKEDADNLTFKIKTTKPDLFKKTEEKVLKALETVEKEPSNPKDKKSPTFGDLLKEGGTKPLVVYLSAPGLGIDESPYFFGGDPAAYVTGQVGLDALGSVDAILEVR